MLMVKSSLVLVGGQKNGHVDSRLPPFEVESKSGKTHNPLTRREARQRVSAMSLMNTR